MAQKPRFDVNQFDINIFLPSVSQGEHNGIKFALAYLIQQGARIMATVQQIVDKQREFNTRQAAAIDSVVASEAGLKADVAELNKKITALQESAGKVTPEDQALIDAIQAEGEALSQKAEAVATALKALDDATPPALPDVPPEVPPEQPVV